MSGKAKFVYWMEQYFDDIPAEPMFNVISNDKALPNGSTVCASTLMTQYEIPLPLFPSLDTWRRETAAKRRCFRCWGCVRGQLDLERHREIVHGEDRISARLRAVSNALDAAKRLIVLALVVATLAGCNRLDSLLSRQRLFKDTSPGPPHPSNQRTYVVAGQSNAVSWIRGSINNPAVGRYSTTARVSLNDYQQDKTRIFVPTLDDPSNYSIGWIYCGDKMAENNHRRYEFVNVAVGGTTTRQWRETYYVPLLDAVRTSHPDAVLWHQGESDYTEGLTEQESYENLRWLIEQTKDIDPDVRWIVALNSDFSAFASHPDWSTIPIRRAEQRVIDEGLALRGPDTDPLRLESDVMDWPAGQHWLDDGFRQFGELWAASIAMNGLN